MGMTMKQKIDYVKEREFTFIPVGIEDDILKNENMVGIYCFYAKKGRQRECFYIGKAQGLSNRLIRSHITGIIYNYDGLVQNETKRFIEEGYKIEIEIIDFTKEYYDSINFNVAAHRLALLEISEIVKKQSIGQCLSQKIDGAKEKQEEKFKEIKKLYKGDANEK